MRYLALFALALAQTALAEFVGGVDNFAGNIKDQTTWTEFRSVPQVTIDQHDALLIDATAGIGEYRATDVRVGAGGWVQVKATVTSAVPPFGGPIEAYLALTSAAPPPDQKYWCTLFSTSLTESLTEPADLLAVKGTYSGGVGNIVGNALLPMQPSYLNRTFILRMDLTDANHILYRGFDPAMNLLTSRTEVYGSLPPLYLTLGAEKAAVTFDDMTAGGNVVFPDPSAATLGAAAVMLGLLRRRPRGFSVAMAPAA